MRTAVISEQGPRWAMEDRYTLISDFGDRGWIFGGVFDGHCGKDAAEYAARHLHQRLLRSLDAGESPNKALRQAFTALDKELAAEESGCTAATFLIQGSRLTTANCGDSGILLAQKNSTLQLSEDHRLDNKAEKERIQEAGARISYPYVMSGFQGLMPTRSFGDARFREAGIIADPWIHTRRLEQEDCFLIAGCDGLFDAVDNETIGSFAANCLDAVDLVQILKREVLEKRLGTDNLTVIACDLKGLADT